MIHRRRAWSRMGWLLAALAGMISVQAAVVAPSSIPRAVSLPESGHRYSAAELFDAGNALSRRGQIGRAILDYERAALLAPTDAAIAANLRHERDQAGLSAENAVGWRQRLESLPTGLVAAFGCLGVAVGGAGWLCIAGRWRRRRAGFVALGLGSLLLALDLACVWAAAPVLSEAVVVSSGVAARSAPAAAATEVCALREGETVTVAARVNGYRLIRTETGQTGWVRRDEVAPIVE